MASNLGFAARLHAKPDKVAEVAAFLQQGREMAANEATTVTWYAFQLDETTFGIFDTFDDEAGRQTHLSGPIAAALMSVSDDLFTQAPEILPVSIVAAK